MNLIVLICIIVSQLIFQALYFEKYYYNEEKKILENEINNFNKFLETNNNPRDIMDYIQNIKRKENVDISLMNSNFKTEVGMESYMGGSYIEVKGSSTGKIYKVLLDQISNIEVKKNDKITVYGIIDKYGYVIPLEIHINGHDINSSYTLIPEVVLDKTSSINTKNIVELNGTVEDKIDESPGYFTISNLGMYLENVDKGNIYLNNEYIGKIKIPNSINEFLLGSKKINNGYIIAVSPLAEVNAVLGVMNNYYLIVFLVALLVVVVISFIYSKILTKPLIEMSSIAKKISKCNFTDKYKVKSEDELGELGGALNLISSNLEESLNDLKNANKQLKSEMEIQRIQEEKRKELISSISHELKTPITIIQGNINGIKSGMYSENVYNDILEETNRLNELVMEMLEVSKLESPTFKLNKEPFDLGAVVLKEIDKLKGIAKEKSLTINHNNYDELVVIGDEKRITQVVQNFLTNAIKYTPENEKINIDIIKEKDKYIFSIENFGVSLNEDELSRIWDSFYRKEKSRNKKFGGTGLGLSIVKRILEIHNSNFGVESGVNSVKFYFDMDEWKE